MALDYDPMSPRWRDDPYPVYRRLRDEAPVLWAPEANAFCVSRYDDVQAVLNDPETFSSRAMFTVLMNGGMEGSPPLSWQSIKALVRFIWAMRGHPNAFLNGRNLIASDGDVHTGMRGIVNRGFTPRRVRDWEPRIRALADECMTKLVASDDFDVVRHLAIPLPVTIIAEMLGVEPERRDDFKRWSDTTIHYAAGPGRADRFNGEFVGAVSELTRYLRQMLAKRRAEPRDDLLSVLLSTQDDEMGLSDAEVIMFVNLLLVAGNETTTNLIGNATNALLDHPDQLDRVAADPSLVAPLIEETLRYDAPVQLVFRTATRDAEIAGTRIPEGAWVCPLLGSANRDERRFEGPDRFDVGRNPQGHVGFGFGKHFCLGASLARLEASAALERLIPELVRRRKREPKVQRIDSFLVRGPSRLPLAPAA
ncbi:MAG: cytochrome P450 [Myxococcota bacterium]